MGTTQRNIRSNARRQYQARLDRRNGDRPNVNSYVADALDRIDALDLHTDTNRCFHCNAKAGHPHDGDCRTTLTWRLYECVELNIHWQGWVLQFESGRRLGYVMRQVVPTGDGMKPRWVPFTWDGAQLSNACVHPHTPRATVESHVGTGACPVNY